MTMTRSLTVVLCMSLAAAGCSGQFGAVSKSIRISDGSQTSAKGMTPPQYRAVVDKLPLAEEIYSKQLENLTNRRNALRTRRRSLTVATYATFAATTLVISAAAIRSSNEAMGGTDSGLRMAGYGALGGLGLGTTLEVVNLMQEDPAAVEAKLNRLVASYSSMVSQLNTLFAASVAANTDPESVRVRVNPIIDAFINEAVQINVKG